MTEPNPSAGASANRIVIVMPTYNERQNLESIAGRVRAALPEADLLVVDDNSPDGTGDLADKLAETDSHVQVMHRTDKAGLGKAYIAGFGWALERGYDVIIEMDADGSHQPEHLPSLVAALNGADLSIGSRWVPGGKVVNWPKTREALSRAANIYTRIMLGLGVRDATAGFRAYRVRHAADDQPGPGGVDRILLPDRPDAARRRRGPADRRGADHVRGTGARRVEDEQQHHHGSVLAGRAVGRARAAAGTAAPAGLAARAWLNPRATRSGGAGGWCPARCCGAP